MLILYFSCFSGEKFKVETKTIVADFEEPETTYDKIKEGLEGLEIGILGLYHTWFLEIFAIMFEGKNDKENR